jgi:flavin-dependent dehydrogenase
VLCSVRIPQCDRGDSRIVQCTPPSFRPSGVDHAPAEPGTCGRPGDAGGVAPSEIIIVGGGPAGTTTALALAKALPELARRTLLLEAARYPRDKPCAGALGARGDALLRALGADVDVPGVAICGMSFRSADGSVVAAPGRIGRVVRRTELDHALARAAAARGVAVRDGVEVRSVRDEGTEGVVVETDHGTLRSRVVVGCDGVGSVVRKALGLGTGRFRAQAVEVDTEPVPRDGDRGLLHFDACDRGLAGYAWDFATLVDGRPLVCRGVYRLKLEGEPADADRDVSAVLAKRLRALGIDPAACKKKRYAERGYDPAARIAAGALMLAGEAAGIDPFTGEGIAQAIEYGVLAGSFLARHFAGRDRDGTPRLTTPRSAVAPSATPERDRASVDVSDWVREVRTSRLGLDLRVRARFLQLYYGRGPRVRAGVERVFTDSPDVMRIGCEHFGGQTHDWRAVGKVLIRGASMLALSRFGCECG